MIRSYRARFLNMVVCEAIGSADLTTPSRFCHNCCPNQRHCGAGRSEAIARRRIAVQQRYRVTWEIDVEADSPLVAAEEAFDCMQGHDTTATVFTVECPSGHRWSVDLCLSERRYTIV
jgi:hypothetical protein